MIVYLPVYREPFWPDGLYQDGDGYYCFDGEIDADTFTLSSCFVGRNNAPKLLFDLIGGQHLDIAAHPGVVAQTWSVAEFPERNMPPYIWVQMFTTAGYTHNRQPASLPTEPVTVYRGSVPKGRFGMSWTSDLELAQKFASGTMYGRTQGHVYMFHAPPAALLAFVGEDRGENEYVINPDYLSKATVKRFNQKRPK